MNLKSNIFEEIYEKLFSYYGPQGWWPGETDFEIMVGAILTQNTNWKNVEKAIQNLKNNALLTPQKMAELNLEELALQIKPSGYYNLKAKRLNNLLRELGLKFDFSIEKLKSLSSDSARDFLLSINGIGPETADSILLYALHKLAFVVDTYTYRVFSRHYLIPEDSQYNEIQETATLNFPPDRNVYQEIHALIVAVGKEYCSTKPKCEFCPLNGVNW